jgi:hypothetical protein
MKTLILSILVWQVAFLTANCHPGSAPIAPTPDAADGAPLTCAAACANEAQFGCDVPADCVTVLTMIDARRTIRLATGYPLTCAGIAAATTTDQLAAAGVTCSDASP